VGCSCLSFSAELMRYNFLCSSKFVFNNPNIKDACGCGESFTVA
jgi:Fe-S cluster assembly iron-binding protein IscA